jgi:hypothetical protein
MSSLDPAERDSLTVSVINQVAVLEVITGFVEGRQPSRMPSIEILPRLGVPFPREESRELLARYLNVFKEEISTVRRVRNSLVHALEVSDGSLVDAADIGNRLMAVLRDTLLKFEKAKMNMSPIRDRSGRVCAWLYDGRALDLRGHTVAFIMDESLVSRRGRHLGTLSNGFFRDKRGSAVAWIEGAQGGPLLPIAMLAPIPPIPDVPPIPPLRPIPPVPPIGSLSWSAIPWDEFVTS